MELERRANLTLAIWPLIGAFVVFALMGHDAVMASGAVAESHAAQSFSISPEVHLHPSPATHLVQFDSASKSDCDDGPCRRHSPCGALEAAATASSFDSAPTGAVAVAPDLNNWPCVTLPLIEWSRAGPVLSASVRRALLQIYLN